MFPSSDPATQVPNMSQEEDHVDWQAPDYPGDQQNTQLQWIASGIPVDDNFDDIFGDGGVEPVPGDHFAPGGYDDAAQLPPIQAYQQPTHAPPPSDYTYQDPGWARPQSQQTFSPYENHIGNSSSIHQSSSRYTYHEGGRTIIDEASVSHHEQQPRRQPQSRQQSLKPEAPYPGYARTSGTPNFELVGESDVPIPRATTSNTDDLFSDEEEDSEEFDGYSDAGRNLESALRDHGEQTGEIVEPSGPSQDAAPSKRFFMPETFEDEEELLEEEEEGEDTGEHLEIEHHNKHRGPSPTESQLEREGFEFHSGLEEEQIAKFRDKAFRKALREVRPELPRKQQWYAYQKIAEMLEKQHNGQGEVDEYDPAQPQLDFPRRTSEAHHVCQCGGDPTKCFCAPGHCGCSGCPRNDSVDEEPSARSTQSNTRQARVEDEQDDAPMDIGTTPITPKFSLGYDKHGIQKIPGLGQLPEESEDGIEGFSPIQPTEQKPRCQCGDVCRCPPGACQCPKLNASAQTPQYNQDRLGEEPLGSVIKKIAEAQRSTPTSPQRNAHPSNPPSSAPARSYYTPQQGFSIVRSSHSESEASTPLGTPPQITPIPPSRPDTPRPHDSDVRESVEPEMPLPNWHRESTPAYTDRSPSPSPTSRNGDFEATNEMDRVDGIPDDVSMRDFTPTVPGSRAFYRSREDSMAPGSPTAFSRSRLSVPRTSSPTLASSPTRHLMPTAMSPRPESQPPSPRRMPEADDTPDATPSQPRSYTQHPIPAPPIPISSAPGLKSTKQRASGGKRKSGVQGSKIEKPKPRNVTAKQTRKATEKIVKQDAKDTKEGKKGGTVKDEVARIEERLQADGTPPRRSGRIRERVASGSPKPNYKGMGG